MDWPEDVLVSWFKLNDNLYHACLACGAPNHLHKWYILAEEVEIDLARNQYRARRTWKRSPPQGKREPFKLQTGVPKSTACFKCGKDGHCAAECCSKTPAQKPDRLSGGKLVKAIPCRKETAMRSIEVVEFCPSPKPGKGIPTPSKEDPGLSESDQEDDPLVSEPRCTICRSLYP